MRTESFHADDLAQALRRSKIATMADLKKGLGTSVDVTVFRKLKRKRTSIPSLAKFLNFG